MVAKQRKRIKSNKKYFNRSEQLKVGTVLFTVCGKNEINGNSVSKGKKQRQRCSFF